MNVVTILLISALPAKIEGKQARYLESNPEPVILSFSVLLPMKQQLQAKGHSKLVYSDY